MYLDQPSLYQIVVSCIFCH